MAAANRRSDVWKYFKQEGSNNARCSLCERSFSYRGGTSNLRDHLERMHSDTYRPKATSTCSRQTTLGLQKCTDRRAQQITAKILSFIVKDIRPIATVEREGFKDMIKLLEPGYEVPCRKYFTQLLHTKYESGVTSLKKIIKDEIEAMGITTDIWTSLTNESYISVTVHYINKEWEMASYILDTATFPGHHTGVLIAQKLKDILSKFEVQQSQVVAIVHDQGSNIELGGQLLENEWDILSLNCAAHKLQLCIAGALKSQPRITRAIDAAKKIVGHFKHSALATSALKQRQVQMSIPEKKLKQDVPTRWNSTFYMVERLLEMRWPVIAVLSDESVTKRANRYLDLPSDQWELLEEMVKVLQPLETATVFLSYEYNVSISCLYPVLFGILENLQVLSEDDSPSCTHLKSEIVSSIKSRWSLNLIDPHGVAIIAAALDPRFRNLKFLTDNEKKSVSDYLKRKVELLQENEEELEHSTRADLDTAPPPKKTALDQLLGDEQEELSSDHEVDAYFSEKVVTRSTNPLQWWKENQSRFPLIAQVARSYLCIPVTSTPSERLFSKAGLVVNKLRSNLKPENVNALLFLNHNANFL